MSPSKVDNTTDTEITLGTGKMLALFFGLVILCAIFFGMGFSMGKNSVRSPVELLPSPSAPTGTRSSASNRPVVIPPPAPESKPDNQAAQPASSGDSATQPANQGSANQGTSQSAASAQPGAPQQGATQPGTGYFVQVAAVSKQEDAEALVESLKGRQYAAFITNTPPDKLFHVQVGPFTDIKDAEGMRSKLVSDGYNPILKK
jgi:cell division septation protein DedD